MIEADFQDQLIDYLRKRHCFVKPLVGNTLMAGMPDLWIANANGWAGHVELKMWEKKPDPFCHDDFYELLVGPQRYTISVEYWQRGVFCPIIALSKRDCTNAWVYYGNNIFRPKTAWQTIADEIISRSN